LERAVLQVAFAGAFAASLEQLVRHHLTMPCETIVADKTDILLRLGYIDGLVTRALTAATGRPAAGLKVVLSSSPRTSGGSRARRYR
jgi:hypothetical protein